MENEEDDLEKDVNSIISQLKGENKEIKKVEKALPSLNMEDVQQFIIDKASAVISHSLDTVEHIKQDTIASGEAGAIEAMAELVKATTSAIDSLSKLKLADDKIKAQKEIKQMDIKAKNLENNDYGGKTGVYISREDLLKELISSSREMEKVESSDDD